MSRYLVFVCMGWIALMGCASKNTKNTKDTKPLLQTDFILPLDDVVVAQAAVGAAYVKLRDVDKRLQVRSGRYYWFPGSELELFSPVFRDLKGRYADCSDTELNFNILLSRIEGGVRLRILTHFYAEDAGGVTRCNSLGTFEWMFYNLVLDEL